MTLVRNLTDFEKVHINQAKHFFNKIHKDKSVGRQIMARYGFIITGKTAGIYTKMLAVCTTEKYITSDFYYLIYF